MEMSSQIQTWSSSTILSASFRPSSSKLYKVYRQASTLFLTRRLPESLSTISPLLNFSPDSTDPPLIYTASKTTRIKVWSLYLTILNAVCELSLDEGKQAFGSADYRILVSKVRDGAIWDEVVNCGYGGSEGDVDTDIVINLATLLLAHARNQKINQERLESYLTFRTVSDHQSPNVSQSQACVYGPSMVSSNRGTDTAQELNALVKVLELYTLHVLLRNNEWDFAHEVITLSTILDEERREAFLEALQTLRNEHAIFQQRALEERLSLEEKLKRDAEEVKTQLRNNEKEEEEERKRRMRLSEKNELDGYRAERKPHTSNILSPSEQIKSSTTKKSSLHPTNPVNRAINPKKATPLSHISRARIIFANIYKILETSATEFKARPFFTLQVLLYFFSLLVILGRRDSRYFLRKSWIHIKQTALMAGKVSYL